MIRTLLLCLAVFLCALSRSGMAETPYNVELDQKCFYVANGLFEATLAEILSVCTLAAESGSPGAQNIVGQLLLDSNEERAVYWLKKAAGAGNTDAIETLSTLSQ